MWTLDDRLQAIPGVANPDVIPICGFCPDRWSFTRSPENRGKQSQNRLNVAVRPCVGLVGYLGSASPLSTESDSPG